MMTIPCWISFIETPCRYTVPRLFFNRSTRCLAPPEMTCRVLFPKVVDTIEDHRFCIDGQQLQKPVKIFCYAIFTAFVSEDPHRQFVQIGAVVVLP